MSFMNLRGEKVVCEKCGAYVTLEHEDGARLTQISDVAVYQQFALYRKLASKSDDEKEGYYFILPVVCENCKDDKLQVFDEDYILFRYKNAYCELTETEDKLLSNIQDEMWNNLSEELLREIDADAFEKLKSEKHFGIKKEKRAVSERYVTRAYDNICRYIKNRIYKDKNVQKLIAELDSMREPAERELNALSEKGLKGYRKFDTEAIRNLNPLIRGDLTMRTPESSEGEVSMYTMVEFNLSEMQEMLKDRRFFGYDPNAEKGEETDWALEDFFKRLPVRIAKTILA